jgi:hypothetical protein
MKKNLVVNQEGKKLVVNSEETHEENQEKNTSSKS